jgi:hypothetical protein
MKPAPPVSRTLTRSGSPGVEDPGKAGFRNPSTAVDNGYPNVTVVSTSTLKPHQQPRVCVPDRICGQVAQRPGQIVGRTEHRQPVIVGKIDFQAYAL